MSIFLNKWFLFVVFCLLCSKTIYAGENLQGAMRAQQQRQQMIQQQVVAQKVAQQQQRLVQERQQAIQQQQLAYQQAIQQKQYIQQQRAQQLQAYQQRALQQRQAYNQAAQQKMAQEVAYKQVAQQQAFQQVLNQRANEQAAYANAAQQQLMANQAALEANSQAQYIQPSYNPTIEADEVTDLEHIWQDLEISSEIWPMILDREPKELTVNRFIESYKKSGIVIRKPASQYVDIIDSMTREPGAPMLKTPFKDLLKVAAIVEYDFDNGLNKDQMALKVLGQQGYEANKKRLGL